MIAEYISRVEDKINQIRWLIKNESFEIEIPEETRIAYLKGNIIFIDNSQLFFSEVVSHVRKSYRFHYVDKNNNLIYRWDTAPHHREIRTHPFHMHTKESILESKPISLLRVLDVISDFVRKSL